MNDDDELNDAEREFLMAQPDSIQDVDIRSTFDTFVDRYPDTPGISHEHLMGSTEDVSRELNFQVSQSYAAFDDEDALRKYGDMMQSNNNSEPVRGLLGLPPLECDSVMLKGDSGVCLWSTLDRPVDVDVTDIETDDVRRQAQRIRSIQASGGSAQSASTINTSIESLLSEYHRQKGDMDARREAGEAERTRRRVELAIRAEEATSASAAAREGGAFQFEPEKEKLWVAKYGPKTFKDLLSDESANLR
ncbi:Hypothetical protein, putative [Bodo saltans]|uniref:Uncharacterized protein n=1 Tax=Bodo saltans TaxID=75058 RepID=A0A0S4J9R6_BODSA|nr:Hypothetical protein, putative [Bodo saltans]|eukprot:CUG88179.1 Hypothetical protein, putative [Bodo saltans]